MSEELSYQQIMQMFAESDRQRQQDKLEFREELRIYRQEQLEILDRWYKAQEQWRQNHEQTQERWRQSHEQAQEQWRQNHEQTQEKWRKEQEQRRQEQEQWRQNQEQAQEKWRKEQEQRRQEQEQAQEKWRKEQEQRRQEQEQAQEKWRKEQEQRRQAQDRWFQKQEQSLEKWRAAREIEWQKTDQSMRNLHKEVNRLRDLFESQWSRLIEALVDGKLVHLLREQSIEVNHTATNVEGTSADGHNYEFDILAVNGNELVVVEVKSRLQSDDVREFLRELQNFKSWLREYQSMTVYGAVAYLRADEAAVRYAENQGMYVIRAVGDSAQIINGTDFKARTW